MWYFYDYAARRLLYYRVIGSSKKLPKSDESREILTKETNNGLKS